MTQLIEIPYAPRKLANDYHNRTERFACIVAHRRFGKTVAAINDLIKDALTCTLHNPRVAYIAPYYSQAKNVVWDYAKYYTSTIPNIKVNESELRIDFPNGARLKLYGSDNYDAMRGLYFDAVCLDEPADFPANAWPTVIRPALADRKGRATFIGTPKGKNEFWEIYDHARGSDTWYTAMHKVSDTGLLDSEELDEALKIMGRDRYDQEFECSFEAALTGAYYGAEMRDLEQSGRICEVQYDKLMPVVVSFDLGMNDSTSLWFAQFAPNGEIRLIDYYENSGVGLDHYAQVLQEKGYIYDQFVLPHDVQVRELGTGKSRMEILQNLGVSPITVAPQLRLDDGIQTTRMTLPKCWFDAQKCKRGIEALKQYSRDFDEKGKVWRGRPKHDWTSHAADSARYLFTGYRSKGSWKSGPIKRNLKGLA